jgi:RLL motif-containing protein 1
VDRAAKLLRLLYVADLRQTQNNVNEAISRMQQHTADPKTDSRLGRVGH